jgi:hypothetical protein
MAVTFVAASAKTSQSVSSGTTVNSSRAITLPAGTTTDDIVFLLVTNFYSPSSSSSANTMTVPSAWTLVEQATATPSNMGGAIVTYGLYWARSPITPGTLTYRLGGLGGIEFYTLTYRGVSSSINPPWEYFYSNAQQGSAPLQVAVPGIGTNYADSRVVAAVFSLTDWTNNNALPTTGWAERLDGFVASTWAAGIEVSDYAMASPGASPSAFVRVTGSGVVNVYSRLLALALVPEGAGTAAPSTFLVNQGGAWKPVESLWANQGGSWRQVQQLHANSAGSWKRVL